MSTTPVVIQHVETHLGMIDPDAGYWRFPIGGYWLQVVAFRNQPRRGVTTLCSLGLWHHELSSPVGNVRQELVMIADEKLVADGRLACVFPSVAEAILSNHAAIVEGQVFGPFGPVIADVSPLKWLLCLAPKPFAPSFAVCETTDPPTQFVWLAPISRGEVDEVVQGRLSDLVRRWEEGSVNLMDWGREIWSE